jgi:hypothetical protein
MDYTGGNPTTLLHPFGTVAAPGEVRRRSQGYSPMLPFRSARERITRVFSNGSSASCAARDVTAYLRTSNGERDVFPRAYDHRIGAEVTV